MNRPPVFALAAFDAAWCALFAVVAGPPMAAVVLAFRALGTHVPLWLNAGLIPLYALAFLAGMTVTTRIVRALAPRLVPGTYRFPAHPMARAWLVHFGLQRILYLPLWRPLLFSVASLRTAALRALGMRVPMAISTGSDPQLLDPSLVRIGPGAVIGADVMTTCHWIIAGRLRLAALSIGENAQIHEGAKIGPGTTVGDGAMVGAEAQVGPDCRLGDRCRLGPGGRLLGDVHIGRGARLGPFVVAERGVRIGRRAVVEAGAHLRAGQVVGEEAVYPPADADA